MSLLKVSFVLNPRRGYSWIERAVAGAIIRGKAAAYPEIIRSCIP
jgi:hypothetical protein